MAWVDGVSIATRLRCGVCRHVSPVLFHVPDEMWAKAVPSEFQQTPMCIHCFASFADERMLPWDEHIQLFPRSLCGHIRGHELRQA